MNKFSDFNIKTSSKGFEGDKIKISKIIGREIIVHDFKIEDSKIYADRGAGKCLHLQISIKDEKYIVFTSAVALIEALPQIPKDAFPFTTTIIKENERLRFS